MTSRDAAQKAAAKEATTVFQNYYPEFLVRHLPLLFLHPPLSLSLCLRVRPLTLLPRPPCVIFVLIAPQSRKFFINVPTLLTWVFWLFKPLISAATLAKMAVVGTGAKTIGAELSPVIDVKELPKRYGGEAEDF